MRALRGRLSAKSIVPLGPFIKEQKMSFVVVFGRKR